MYKFKQQVSFGIAPNKVLFKLGVHQVPEHIVNHHYFKKLLKSGLVVEAGSAEAAAPAPGPSLEAQKKAVELAKAQASQKLADYKAEDEAQDKSEDEEPKAKKGKR